MTDVAPRDQSTVQGQIVLQCRTATPNRIALETAVHLAKAFRFHIKSVFVEDQDVLTLADLPFAVEISRTGTSRPIADLAEMEGKMRSASAALRQLVEQLAQANAISCTFSTVRGEVMRALEPHCMSNCYVVMADTFDRSHMAALRHLFDTIDGLSGALLVGPDAQQRRGPVVALMDADAPDEALVRIARMIARERRCDYVTLSVRDAEKSVALNAGLYIARRGQSLRPGDGDLRRLVNGLNAPLLLLR